MLVESKTVSGVKLKDKDESEQVLLFLTPN
jgi:hypothetical protein